MLGDLAAVPRVRTLRTRAELLGRAASVISISQENHADVVRLVKLVLELRDEAAAARRQHVLTLAMAEMMD